MRRIEIGVVCVSLMIVVSALCTVPSTIRAGNREPPEIPRELIIEKDVNLTNRRFVVAGDESYVIGTQDGNFPPMGWHIRGEMGGVWSHPIKLLDGYWVQIEDQWLTKADKFVVGPGYSEIHYILSGLEVTRKDFCPDGKRGVITYFTLKDTTGKKRVVNFTYLARTELMSSYPWSWSKPSAEEVNGIDAGFYASIAKSDQRMQRLMYNESIHVVVCEDRDKWVIFGSNEQPISSAVNHALWGPIPRSQRPDCGDKGVGGELTYRVTIPAGGSEVIKFVVAGSTTSSYDAIKTYCDLNKNDPELFDDKVRRYMDIANLSDLNIPDNEIKAAFLWGKLNTEMLVLQVPGFGRGIGGGFPDYPWWFGCDGEYTVPALLVTGQSELAKDHLRLLKRISELTNGNGKIVHEIVSDGTVYWGKISDPGNTNEAVQFVKAVYQVYRWTGDDKFLKEMYPFAKKSVFWAIKDMDTDNDSFPEGYGMVEREGMGHEKLDVVCYTYEAINALGKMASAMNDSATQSRCNRLASDLRDRINKIWWMPDWNLYADSLTETNEAQQDTHWIVAVPMESMVAPREVALRSFQLLESSEFTDPSYGLYHTALDTPTNPGPDRRVWTLPNSVMAVGECNYGQIDKGIWYSALIAKSLDHEMPGALPEIVTPPLSSDLRELACFLQAWSSYGIAWPLITQVAGVNPNVPDRELSIIPDLPEGWSYLNLANLTIGDELYRVEVTYGTYNRTITVSKSSTPYRLNIGATIPKNTSVTGVTLNGDAVPYDVIETNDRLRVVVSTSTDTENILRVSFEFE